MLYIQTTAGENLDGKILTNGYIQYFLCLNFDSTVFTMHTESAFMHAKIEVKIGTYSICDYAL